MGYDSSNLHDGERVGGDGVEQLWQTKLSIVVRLARVVASSRTIQVGTVSSVPLTCINGTRNDQEDTSAVDKPTQGTEEVFAGDPISGEQATVDTASAEDAKKRRRWPLVALATVGGFLLSLLGGWLADSRFRTELIYRDDNSAMTYGSAAVAGLIVLILGAVALRKMDRRRAMLIMGVAVMAVFAINLVGTYVFLSTSKFSVYSSRAFVSDYEIVQSDKDGRDRCRIPDGTMIDNTSGLPELSVTPLNGVGMDDIGSPVEPGDRGDRGAYWISVEPYEYLDLSNVGPNYVPLGDITDVNGDGQEQCYFSAPATVKGSLIAGGKPLFIESNCGVVEMAVAQDFGLFEEDCILEQDRAAEILRKYGDRYGA